MYQNRSFYSLSHIARAIVFNEATKNRSPLVYLIQHYVIVIAADGIGGNHAKKKNVNIHRKYGRKMSKTTVSVSVWLSAAFSSPPCVRMGVSRVSKKKKKPEKKKKEKRSLLKIHEHTRKEDIKNVKFTL